MKVVLSYEEFLLARDGISVFLVDSKPVASVHGLCTLEVPDDQLPAFKELVAQKGGKLEEEVSLRCSFRGVNAHTATTELISPFHR